MEQIFKLVNKIVIFGAMNIHEKTGSKPYFSNETI